MLTGIYTTALVITPFLASKFISIAGYNLSGATCVFPLTFIINDIFTEVYGFKKSQFIILTGFTCQALTAFFIWIVGALPAASFWHNQAAYDALHVSLLRIVLASFTAYLCGEFANSLVLSKLKTQHVVAGKASRDFLTLSKRFVLSTIIGQTIDSVLFLGIGFYGVVPTNELLVTMVTITVAKILYETAMLPISVPVSNFVKRFEGVDVVDGLPGVTAGVSMPGM